MGVQIPIDERLGTNINLQVKHRASVNGTPLEALRIKSVSIGYDIAGASMPFDKTLRQFSGGEIDALYDTPYNFTLRIPGWDRSIRNQTPAQVKNPWIFMPGNSVVEVRIWWQITFVNPFVVDQQTGAVTAKTQIVQVNNNDLLLVTTHADPPELPVYNFDPGFDIQPS